MTAATPSMDEGFRKEFRRDFKVNEGNLRLDQFLANQSKIAQLST